MATKIPPHKKPDPERINLTPIPMTPEGIEALQEKLARLKARLPALAEETARTAAYGDRSDNAEYKLAKSALRRTTFESYRIEDQLKRVVPIVRGSENGAVRLGSVVTVEVVEADADVDAQAKAPEKATVPSTADRRLFEILGPTETDPSRGRISHESPLGKALIGHKKGDIVAVSAENGKKEYRIVDVD